MQAVIAVNWPENTLRKLRKYLKKKPKAPEEKAKNH